MCMLGITGMSINWVTYLMAYDHSKREGLRLLRNVLFQHSLSVLELSCWICYWIPSKTILFVMVFNFFGSIIAVPCIRRRLAMIIICRRNLLVTLNGLLRGRQVFVACCLALNISRSKINCYSRIIARF
jgi:uncharacterized protein YybS (DUF2232 family)